MHDFICKTRSDLLSYPLGETLTEQSWCGLADPAAVSILSALGGRCAHEWCEFTAPPHGLDGRDSATFYSFDSYQTVSDAPCGPPDRLSASSANGRLMHWMAAGCVTVVGVEDGSVRLSFGRRGVGGLFTILVTDWISWHRLLRDAAARLQVRMPKWTLEYFTSYEMETLSYLCQMSLQMAVQLDSALHNDFIYRLQTRVSVDRSAINCRAWTELVHGVLRQGHNAVAWGKLVR